MEGSYLKLWGQGKLEERIHRGLQWMNRCTLCPRLCKVNRNEGEAGYCRTSRQARVASYGPHFGEERPLVGQKGSGAIFFSYCNLGCVFCQNQEISHGGEGVHVGPETLGDIMISLQERGCHNINFVTPTHVVPQILEALPHAIEKGLKIPLVYNCGGYERPAALKLLEGIVDLYMPDFKFWDAHVAEKLCGASDYPERARESLLEMQRQVGELQWDEKGVAQKGLLVRHLVMPEGLAGTEDIVRFIAEKISPRTYVNIMSQYHPCGEALKMPRIARRVTGEEFEAALDAAARAGLERLDDRHKHWIDIFLP